MAYGDPPWWMQGLGSVGVDTIQMMPGGIQRVVPLSDRQLEAPPARQYDIETKQSIFLATELKEAREWQHKVIKHLIAKGHIIRACDWSFDHNYQLDKDFIAIQIRSHAIEPPQADDLNPVDYYKAITGEP